MFRRDHRRARLFVQFNFIKPADSHGDRGVSRDLYRDRVAKPELIDPQWDLRFIGEPQPDEQFGPFVIDTPHDRLVQPSFAPGN